MREVSLGQIAYEAHFGATAGDYDLQSAKQQERWQRSAEAVLAAALDDLRRRERSIGAEEELRRLAVYFLDRADAIAAERSGEGGAA